MLVLYCEKTRQHLPAAFNKPPRQNREFVSRGKRLLVGEDTNVDLEFDERFLIIDQLISEHESDFDAPLRKGKDPFDWGRVADDCEALSRESNDLRIAVWWLRARAEVLGLAGWVDSLSYILELLELPDTAVHPQGDEDLSTGELHATALGWLASPRGLAAFRKLPLTADREWQVAFLLPDAGDPRQSSEVEQGKFREALLLDQPRTDLSFALLNRARACLEEISLRLDERCPDGGGDFSELISSVGHAAHRLQPMTSQAHQAEEAADEAEALVDASEPASPRVVVPEGSRIIGEGFSIHSRDEVRIVLAALDRYYREYESGHPVGRGEKSDGGNGGKLAVCPVDRASRRSA